MGGPDAKWGGTLEDMDALEEQYIEILEECGFVEKKLEAFLGGILRTYYVKDNIAVSVNQSKNFSWLYVDIQEM